MIQRMQTQDEMLDKASFFVMQIQKTNFELDQNFDKHLKICS